MRVLLLISIGLFALAGLRCQDLYYEVWEGLGKEKRDLLRSEIKGAKDDQEEVRETLSESLTRLRRQNAKEPSDLEKTYDSLSGDYDRAKSQAAALSKRIAEIDRIAKDLFIEWEGEAKTLSNPEYRSASLKSLSEAKVNYTGMRGRLKAVEAKLAPVLVKLRDQVLFLKHNLNASTLAVFQSEFNKIEVDVQALVREIETSMQAADRFIKDL